MRSDRRHVCRRPDRRWFDGAVRLKILPLIAALGAVGTSGVAQEITPLLKGDVTAFETCFLQLMLDNPDNFALDLIGPIICGERSIPMGQTCDAVGYMLFAMRADCKASDLIYWDQQVAARAAAAIADGRNGVGTQFAQGLQRCLDSEVDGEDLLDCQVEVHWRTTMEFIAADLVADVTGANE